MTFPGRPKAIEAGLAVVVIVVPMMFFPGSVAPFSDIKGVLLALGALLIGVGAPVVQRRMAAAAGLWVAALVLASALGVDPWQSVMGAEVQGVGLLVLLSCALLLATGSGLAPDLAARLPGWIVGTAAAVASVAILARFLPQAFWGPASLLTYGSTVGQRVHIGGITAAALVATVALTSLRTRQLVALVVLISSGLSVSANRTAWLATAVGLSVAARRARLPVRRTMLIAGTVVVTLGLWTVVDLVVSAPTAVSPARRFAEIKTAGVGSRPSAWTASTRAFGRRPVMGWGPANTFGAYLSSVRPAELRKGERGYGDAHNVAIESLTTTGVIGTTALLLLGFMVLGRARRAPPHQAWALGGASALLLHHLLQPLSVSLTPLLFLLAGLAASGRDSALVRLRGRWLVPAGVVILALTALRFGSSALDLYGRTYDSPRALRSSLLLDPLRSSSAQALARRLTFDARAGAQSALLEARRLTQRDVRRHSWSPPVRLAAADMEVLLGEGARAQRYVDEHLSRFPNDFVALTGAAVLAQRRGEIDVALRLARRSIWINPSSRARRLVNELTTSSR